MMEVLIKTDFLTYLRSVEVKGNNPRANCGVPLRVDEAFLSANYLSRRWPSCNFFIKYPVLIMRSFFESLIISKRP